MITLLPGDCLEVMKDLPDNSVDMLLTDPPYAVTARNAWDVLVPFEKLWPEWKRIVRPGGGPAS